MHKPISICGLLLLLATVAFAQSGTSIFQKALSCDDQSGVLCTVGRRIQWNARGCQVGQVYEALPQT